MEMYALSSLGASVAKSTNGIQDKNNPNYPKWKVLYTLRFLHLADKERICRETGLSPATVSIAIASLKQNNLVVSS